MVTLIPEPVRPSQPFLFKKATADSKGRFRLTGVAPGDYKIYAWGEFTDTDPEFFAQSGSPGTKITVTESGRETVNLQLIKLTETN